MTRVTHMFYTDETFTEDYDRLRGHVIWYTGTTTLEWHAASTFTAQTKLGTRLLFCSKDVDNRLV
jgi:hypothetical protein